MPGGGVPRASLWKRHVFRFLYLPFQPRVVLDQQKKRRPAIDFVMFSMYVAAQLSPAAMFISQRAVIHGKPVVEPNKTKQQLFDVARVPAH